jgi:hypothetical protein
MEVWLISATRRPCPRSVDRSISSPIRKTNRISPNSARIRIAAITCWGKR